MDGASRCLGCKVDVTLGGRTYLLHPLTLGDLGTIEAHLLAERGNPLQTLADAMSSSEDPSSPFFKALWEVAQLDVRSDRGQRCMTIAQIEAWIREPAGVAFTAWLLLHTRRGPAFEFLEDARRAVRAWTALEVQHFLRRRDVASGTDYLGALDWPADAEGRKGKEEKPRWFPWKSTMRKLLNEGVTWDFLRDLTVFQLRVLMARDGELGGVARVSPAKVQEMRETIWKAHGIQAPPEAKRPAPTTTIRERLIAAGKFKPRAEDK